MNEVASRVLRLAVLAGAGLAAAAPASAQARPAPSAAAPAAPVLSQPAIDLAEAVKLTIANDPQVRLAQNAVRSNTGQLQAARGVFDWTLGVRPGFVYTNTPLLPSVASDEVNRRLKFQAVATAFGIVNRSLLNQLGQQGPRPPRCPIEFASPTQILNEHVDPLSFSLNIPGFEGAFQNTRITITGSGMSETLALMRSQMNTVCQPAGSVSPNPALLGNQPGVVGSANGLLYDLATDTTLLSNNLKSSGLEEAMVTLLQAPTEIMTLAQQIAYAASSQATLAFNRLGLPATDEVVSTAKLDALVSKAFRNGITGSMNLHLQSVNDVFKDKPIDAAFGGHGIPIKFNSSVFGTLSLPLARGRGKVSFDAPERAADLNLAASRAQLRHTAQEEAFRTVLAYLALVGVQANARSLEESVARQQQIFRLSEQLVASGDMAAAELDRARARTATVQASLSEARSALVDARVSLAEAMGVDATAIENAPLASASFAEDVAPVPDVDSLTRAALSSRFDVRALASLRGSAQVLYQASLADARPRMDFSVTAGMGSFYEDPRFIYLPDELNPVFSLIPSLTPVQTAGDPVRFGSPLGYYRSMFQGKWKPIFKASFTMELPFRNNRLAGRVAQAEASLDQAQIQERDLARVIRENIITQVGQLKADADAVQRQQDAVKAAQATHDASVARFQQNDITLIDLLLTEDNLTQARLALAAARQKYLSDLARLRFETGTLVTVDGEPLSPEQVRFDPSGFVR